MDEYKKESKRYNTIDDLKEEVHKNDTEIENKINKLNDDFDLLIKNINALKNSSFVYGDNETHNKTTKKDEVKMSLNDAILELDKIINDKNIAAHAQKEIKEDTKEAYKPIINDELDYHAKRVSEDNTVLDTLLNINNGIEFNTEEKEETKEEVQETQEKKKVFVHDQTLKAIVGNLNSIINLIKPQKNKVKYQKEEEEETITPKEETKEETTKYVFTPLVNKKDESCNIISSLNTILNDNAKHLTTNKVVFKQETEPIEKKEEVMETLDNNKTNDENDLDTNIEKIISEIEETLSNTSHIEASSITNDKEVEEKIEETKKEVIKKEILINKANKVKDRINSFIEKQSDKIKNLKMNKTKKNKKTINNINDGDNNSYRPKPKKATMVFAVIAIIIVIFEIAGFVGAFAFASKLCEGMPEFSPADLDSADSTIIYDSQGNQVMELGLYLRENIEYDDIPNCVIDAFVAIEDSRFYEHFGFDIPRFTKAIIENLKTRSFGQGGSTFTMQLVKISYFQTDDGENSTMAAREGMSGVQRKMQEIVLAMQAEKELSKKELLVLYLNKLNFGDNIRGIQKAAEYYFGKDASELNLNEAAFLAGIINAPNGNNPYNAAYGNPEYLENANARKNEVLDLMVYHGYITKDEAELNKAVKVEDLLAGKQSKFAETNPYYQSFIDAVINEAERVTGKNPYTTAMNIYTSMDPYLQEYVYNMQNNPEIFDKYIFRHDNQQNALVILNNQTGELVALGGGRNQADEARQFNRAIDSYINPGSSIKPVLEYALAFDRLGYATSHTICDKPIFLYETDIAVTNAYGQGYTGDMQITEALAKSLNTPAIQLLEEVIEKYDDDGAEVIKYCNSIGFDWCNKDTFDIQWAIGGKDCLVSPVQLAAAHGMLMHEGKYIAPHTIKKIEYRGKYNVEPDFIADTEGTQVLSKAAAFMTAYCERFNVTSGWISQLNLLRRDYPTYGKTGTTNFAEEAYDAFNIPETAAKDQWLCTQTSNYTIVVWNGFDKVDSESYFTVTDENYNLKCKMGSMLLDATMDHFNYPAKEIEKPDDCIEIQHLLGCFPYAIGSSAKGYIKKDSEYATLVDASTIEKERVGGTLYHMGAKATEEGMMIHWDEFNSYLEDGTVDLTATSVSGKVTIFATGRSYYQRYNFVKPDMFYATITAASGEVVEVESPLPTTVAEVAGEGPYTVCGWTSANPNQVCTTK